MTARLISRTGKAAGFDAEVPGDVLVGASPDADVRVPFVGISRDHARLWRSGESYWLEDRESTNGTFVNGQRVDRVRLRHLDVITLGRSVDLIFLEREGRVAPISRETVEDARIEWLDGPNAGETEQIGRGEVTFGRDWSCNIPVESSTISSVHARLERGRNFVMVQDLGSTNGTYVNDRRVRSPQPLRDGDVVRLGPEASFRVRMDATVEEGAAAEPAADTMVREMFDQGWRTRLIWSPEELEAIESVRGGGRAPEPEEEETAAAADDAAAEAPTPSEEKAEARRPSADEAGAAEPGGRAGAEAADGDDADGAATQVGQPMAEVPDVPAAVAEAARAGAEKESSSRTQVGSTPTPDEAVPGAVAEAAGRAREPSGEETVVEPRDPGTAGPSAAEEAGPAPTVRFAGEAGDFEVGAGETTIGRDPDADVVVDSNEISRFHARVVVSGGGVTVEDLDSVNGTNVNDEPVGDATALSDGDVVTFSRLQYTVSISDPEESDAS